MPATIFPATATALAMLFGNADINAALDKGKLSVVDEARIALDATSIQKELHVRYGQTKLITTRDLHELVDAGTYARCTVSLSGQISSIRSGGRYYLLPSCWYINAEGDLTETSPANPACRVFWYFRATLLVKLSAYSTIIADA